MTKLPYSELRFVSGNAQKCEEYRSLLGISDLKHAEISVVEPQGINLEALVEDKIAQIARKLPGVPFFVEHTGLVIDAWKGLPGGLIGVFMKTVGNDGICRMMSAYEGTDRRARASVVIGYFHQPSGIQLFHGDTPGTISEEPRGSANFGWDPIFIPEGSEKTYGEMSIEEKNHTSMRRKATGSFAAYLSAHFELA
jgi:non-canonical purine NTP pyrophosphatase (RdgB/HAM1 family)